jgi:hypothetical protein
MGVEFQTTNNKQQEQEQEQEKCEKKVNVRQPSLRSASLVISRT